MTPTTTDRSTARPTATAPGSPPSDAQLLVRHVGAWMLAQVCVRGRRATIHAATPRTCVATLDLTSGALTVFVSRDMADPILEVDGLWRATRRGLRVDVRDAASRSAAERLIRWALELRRFHAQGRAASP